MIWQFQWKCTITMLLFAGEIVGIKMQVINIFWNRPGIGKEYWYWKEICSALQEMYE